MKIEQPTIINKKEFINNTKKDYTGKLLIGSFLINGKPSGLFLRVGERITGNLSMFFGITTTL